MDPWHFTGFTDAQGCFSVTIKLSETPKLGWSVEPFFSITQHKNDKNLLLEIQDFLGGIGKIYNTKSS